MFGFSRRSAKRIVRRYVTCFNRRDIAGIADLLHPDCCLIDNFGERIEGRASVVEATRQLFAMDPDLSLRVDTVVEHEGDLMLRGHASASIPELAGPAMWRATCKEGLIICWQSFGPDEQAHLVEMLRKSVSKT